MHATNPFTPPNREPNRIPAQARSWRRPIRIACAMGIVVLILIMIDELSTMVGQSRFKFTVQLESWNGEWPVRMCLISGRNLNLYEDPRHYREPWNSLFDPQRNSYGFYYDESYRGEPIPFTIEGDTYESFFRIERSYHSRFLVLAEWSDGTKTAQIETLPDYSKSKTVRVPLVR